MKRKIEVFDYTKEIFQPLQEGVLLTTKADGKVNTMTISWGALGIEWGKPTFITYVRESRYTRQLLEKNPEFTVNIPYGDFSRKILSFCGTKSGRDVDKIRAMGLTLEDPETVSVPSIRELPLTLECRVVYKQAQDPEAITAENKEKFYPQNVGSAFHGETRDYHTAYYGEITAAYIIE